MGNSSSVQLARSSSGDNLTEETAKHQRTRGHVTTEVPSADKRMCSDSDWLISFISTDTLELHHVGCHSNTP